MNWRGIAISGKAGSGKSTITGEIETILRHGGHEIRSVSFAEPVKAVTREILESLGLDVSGNWKLAYRPQLQVLGTAMRRYNPNVWVEIAMTRISDGKTFVLNDDLRFPNELEALKSNDIYTVRLEASPEIRGRRILLKGEGSPTETSLDDAEFDMVIDQDECLEVLGSVPSARFFACAILDEAGIEFSDELRT